jgi:hypothetical protein
MKFTVLFSALALAMITGAYAEPAQHGKIERLRIGIATPNGSATGMSFLPPDEKGWDIKRSGLSVTLKKKGESPDENREIEAYMINLDVPASPISAYIERIKTNTQDAYADDDRYRIAAFEVSEDPKYSLCARVHLLLEDALEDELENTLEDRLEYRLENASKKPQPMQAGSQQKKIWSEQYMISCGSQKYKRIGFEVRYYHRFYEPNRDAQLLGKANKVLDSILIEDK